MKQLLLFLFTLITGVAFTQQIFQHSTNTSNISGNSTFLNAEGLNNNPNAVIIIEFNAVTRAANPHAVGVWYDVAK